MNPLKYNIDILIIDDHPIIIDAYKSVLKKNDICNNSHKYSIKSAFSISETIKLLFGMVSDRDFQIILLDINLPPCNEHKMKSGIDLGVFIRNNFANSKIIVITSCNDNHKLINVIQKINPEGFLIKSDINGSNLTEAVNSIALGKTFYSATVIDFLRKKIAHKFIVDELDVQLLEELSNGSKMKELLMLIPLSKSGIEKRKRLLKEKFGVNDNSDRSLVLVAKNEGII